MDQFFKKSCKKFTSFLFKEPPLFIIRLCYFVIVSLLGFLALECSMQKNSSVIKPNSLDLFFTSVSAVTVSSMSTIEMEVFSDTQLIILIILMLFGGEIFTSMLNLQLKKLKLIKNQETRLQNIEIFNEFSKTSTSINAVRLGMIGNNHKQLDDYQTMSDYSNEALRFNCIKILIRLVLYYLFVVHVIGLCLISIYMNLVPTARDVLKKKGLHLPTFSIFTTVSTFSNCGFTPNNESMLVFKKNPGFLLILIPQVLLGNTLYPVCLVSIVWVLKKMTKKEEFCYMLSNPGDLKYHHLFPGRKAIFLAGTVLGFILVQFVMFCSLEWYSEATVGLNSYEKLVGTLLQVSSSRHAGETVFDLSLVSSASLVVFTVMMYLPPYTSLSPNVFEEIEEVNNKSKKDEKKSRRKSTMIDCLYFSHLSYLVIFIVLICITEKDKMEEDPLNFHVFNIVFEVISAYGNVGLSTGYSCARQMKPDGQCKDAWFGFVGRWSNKGKFILILVMFFGRLKNVTITRSGKAWKLS